MARSPATLTRLSPSTATALPPATPPTRARPPSNAGNTCYLNAVLIALFADFDAWDGLLATDGAPRAIAALPATLRRYVISLRHGHGVAVADVSAVRHALVEANNWPAGHGQHDAAEFFAALLDALDAPFVPLLNHLRHAGRPDIERDHAPFTERILWLTLPADAPDTDRPVSLRSLVDAYFYGDVLHGLRRPGTAAPTTAAVSRTLIPSYTPVRETGETVSAPRRRFSCLTIPFAISRFSATGDAKTRTPIHIPMVLPATRYVALFANGYQHTLILRSVVCHLGNSLRMGHYVTYTYTPAVGWRRWDDLEPSGAAPVAKGDVHTGAPEDAGWADEMRRNCYLLFYELVPGDGDQQRHNHLYAFDERQQTWMDATLAAQTQVEEDYVAALHTHIITNGNESLQYLAPSEGPLSERAHGRMTGGGNVGSGREHARSGHASPPLSQRAARSSSSSHRRITPPQPADECKRHSGSTHTGSGRNHHHRNDLAHDTAPAQRPPTSSFDDAFAGIRAAMPASCSSASSGTTDDDGDDDMGECQWGHHSDSESRHWYVVDERHVEASGDGSGSPWGLQNSHEQLNAERRHHRHRHHHGHHHNRRDHHRHHHHHHHHRHDER